MTDAFDLEIRYGSEIEIAKKFLSSKTKKAGRTPANAEQKQHFLDMNADCPLCGDPFHDGNHNTEHIFPISLGGKNTLENRIQLCRMCNNSRNKVMQSTFADNPRSAYPEKWVHIKKVLLWHIITIDDGIEAGKLIPSIHELFMTYATGGKPFPNQPKRAFGRFSTWKVGDEPNYLHNNSSINKTPNPTSTKSVTLSFFDWMFGYKSNSKTKPKEIKSSKIDPATETPYPRIKYVNTKSGLRLPRNPVAFANALVWLSKNITEYTSHVACRDAIKQAGITSKTPVPVLLGLYKVYDEEQQFEAASKHISNTPPLQLCNDFVEYYSNNKISGMDPAPELSEIKEGLDEYMNVVTTHLSAAEDVA